MIKKTIGFPGEKKFKFYTYDPCGRDAVIVLWAMDQAEAWVKFDRIYGEQTPVDKVEMIKQEYAAAGYSVPNVVFWNLKEYGNRPAKSSTPGVALVSGFSPAILSSVLGREIKSPYDTMMDVIGNPRYEFE